MKRIALVAGVWVGIVSIAGATQRNSFLSVYDLTGISAVSSNGGLTWDISLDSGGGSFKYLGNTYYFTEIFGFWELDTTHTFTRTGSDDGDWRWDDSTVDGGNVFGWVNPSKSESINAGETHQFNFDTIGNGAAFESLGFHVTTTGLFPGTTGNTGHITEDGLAPPVPEPFTMGLVAAALGVAARKRLRRS